MCKTLIIVSEILLVLHVQRTAKILLDKKKICEHMERSLKSYVEIDPLIE